MDHVWTLFYRTEGFEDMPGVFESAGDALVMAHRIYSEDGYEKRYGPIKWVTASSQFWANVDGYTGIYVSRVKLTPASRA